MLHESLPLWHLGRGYVFHYCNSKWFHVLLRFCNFQITLFVPKLLMFGQIYIRCLEMEQGSGFYSHCSVLCILRRLLTYYIERIYLNV